MATLAANKTRAFEAGIEPIMNDLPVIASDIIYEGSMVGQDPADTAEHVRPLVAADTFLGFADQICDNSAGAAGAKLVHIRTRGAVQIAVGGTEPAGAYGAAVYASDDDTATFTAASNSPIGTVHRKVSTGVYIVFFEGTARTVKSAIDLVV